MENRARRNTNTYTNVNVYKPPEDSVKVYGMEVKRREEKRREEKRREEKRREEKKRREEGEGEEGEEGEGEEGEEEKKKAEEKQAEEKKAEEKRKERRKLTINVVLVGKDLVPEGTKSDLSCEAIYGGHSHATKSVKDDNAPYWDEALRIPTHELKGMLKLQVRDKLSDKITGWADLKLEDLPPMFDDWVRLQDDKGGFAGEVRVTIANEIGLH